MSFTVIIPARYAATRLPGKLLLDLMGKPLLQHTFEQAQKSDALAVFIATDDARIETAAKKFGAKVIMTSDSHVSGTDRLQEAASLIGLSTSDVVVNVQGDEPLIDPATIDACADCLVQAVPRGIGVSTGYLLGATVDQMASPSCVHVVPTLDGCVLSFSRLPVPLAFREAYTPTIHIGLYAFTRAALEQFSNWERGPVERAESIELMRFLEHGERVACVAISSGSIGVDHPEDIKRVEAVLKNTN